MLTFLSVKFFSLGLLSARSLILAALLGPQGFGVYGTLVLLQQYLSYAALGMREGVAVSLARSDGKTDSVHRLYASALAWGCCVGCVILVALLGGSVFAGLYRPYLPLVAAISFLAILNEIMININRDQNNLRKVAMIEVAYNAAPLLVAVVLWRSVTISAVLLGIVCGLVVSVGLYSWTLPRLRWRDVDRLEIRKLVTIGFPLSILSVVTLLVNSAFVVLGNWMKLGEELGRVVFATSVCTIVLYGLNTIAWARTSRSMRGLYQGQVQREERRRTARVRTMFHLGVVVAAAACLSATALFSVVLQKYAGSEIYAFFICMYQVQGLLLFNEINYLSVTGRSHLVIAGYCVSLIGIFLAWALFPKASISVLAEVGIAANCVLSAVAFYYCRALREGPLRDAWRTVFLAFPMAVTMAYWTTGRLGAMVVCLAFAGTEWLFARTTHET